MFVKVILARVVIYACMHHEAIFSNFFMNSQAWNAGWGLGGLQGLQSEWGGAERRQRERRRHRGISRFLPVRCCSESEYPCFSSDALAASVSGQGSTTLFALGSSPKKEPADSFSRTSVPFASLYPFKRAFPEPQYETVVVLCDPWHTIGYRLNSCSAG
jgi:hypothetical protein